MEQNRVELIGTVKRNESAATTQSGGRVMDFAVEVLNASGRLDFFDCRVVEGSKAMGQLEGYVVGGEEIAIVGHLERRTHTDKARVAGAMIEARTTATIIMVDEILEG